MQATKKPRGYQVEARRAILSAWTKHRSCLAVMATGAGKTFVAANTSAAVLDQDPKARVLFLANRNELVMQPMEVFASETGEIPGLEKAESRAPLDSRVVIGSVQTLARQNRLERFPADHFSHIWADEAHLSVSESWQKVLGHWPKARLCGITATPFRSDAKLLSDIYEVEAFRKGIFDLVDEGYLVDPDHVFKLEAAISLAQVRIRQQAGGRDYDMQDAHDAIVPYFDEIALELKKDHSNKKILAFLPLVASSQKFVEACRKAGIKAVHIDGNDPERDQKLAAFKDGQIELLSNSNLLHTGVDMPACSATLCLRPTKSTVLYQQIVGRSTRTLPGVIDGHEMVQARLRAIALSSKPRSYILDPLWLNAQHGLATPSSLIAPSEDFAQEMDKKSSKSYSLRVLRSQVQAEREEAIRRRLDNVARFRTGKVQAQWFAAEIGDHDLVNYEAAYAWELQPVSNFSKILLTNAGIDPDSVPNEGMARQVMLAVGRRRNKRLREIRELADQVERDGVTPELWTLGKPGATKRTWASRSSSRGRWRI